MAATTSTIGTGKTYSTIAAWEDAQDANPDNQDTGYCEAEALAAVAFAGGTYTATNYPHLTAKLGAEHDGRAHERSGAGNARIEVAAATSPVSIDDEYVRVSWMEVKGPGDNRYNIGVSCTASYPILVHHCIVHNNNATGLFSSASGITENTAGGSYIYRNICYGYKSYGIITYGANAIAALLCNTVYCNGYSGDAGIRDIAAVGSITNNACFANTKDFYNTNGVMDYNASSDTTADDEGANSIANLTTANQFVAPTTTWAETDLLHKLGAGIIGEGVDLSGDVATYPEINVSIRNGATRATIGAGVAWDIGADQYVAAAPAGVPMPILLSSRRRWSN
ncbi:MAG: hypothetical protein IMZ50_16830 [Candidatus Atribacteria bacterium]|nr:hypothetical protein [Candidatus Atribacteria bacterium]